MGTEVVAAAAAGNPPDLIPAGGNVCHAVLFPFMSKGHTIPILHLARLLLRRQISLTVFTTPANRPFIATSLPAGAAASIIELPFPHDIPEISAGVESTDKLPSVDSLFPHFALATERIRPDFESALENLRPRPSFMVSDGFLWWTQDSSAKFGIPRLVFYGMSNHAGSVSRAAAVDRLLLGSESDDELISVTQFPGVKVCKSDFEEWARKPNPEGPHFDFVLKSVAASSRSYGYMMNSFYELESVFSDHLNGLGKQRYYSVGPLCLADVDEINGGKEAVLAAKLKPAWIQWLDEKLAEGKSVLYVAFGSQAEISEEQLEEIARGLEDSEVEFLWVKRKGGGGLEERVKGRGMIVGEWVDQREILGHASVGGFLSHCGWNSVMESVCAGVAMLAWPMMAEQPLNARMVAEEVKVGIRVEGSGRTGFVRRGALEKAVRELMAGEKGKEVRRNAKEYAEKAMQAMEEGSGSSWKTLNLLIDELCNKATTEN
ncbi:unnamed protein product [Linum tenue]|uniref:Tudor domain-containing protein n=1 Tax=Linum tenue TaxID=586396 RepID=A0AAV0NA34_9ROSI|nr:unnamed protein product [Linum tenue]